METKITRAGTTPSAPRNYSLPFGILLLAAGGAAFVGLLLVGLRTVAYVDEQVPLSDFSDDVRSEISAARFDSADVQMALRGVLQAFSGRGG